MRASFYLAGENIPYKTIYLPLTQAVSDSPVLIGGEFDVLRGEFPGAGNIQVSHPITLADGSWIKTGDWIRIWLDDDDHDNPTFLGEVLTEGWDSGPGEIQIRGLTERVKKLAWFGIAKGSLNEFMSTVISKTEMPRGISVKPWNFESDSTFASNTPFELLGDTFQAIEPALGNFKLGVDSGGQLAITNPGNLTTIRFTRTMSNQPPGNFDSFVNSVRFKFEYPNGDPGYVEASIAESVQSVGHYWDSLTSETLPIVSGEEPFVNIPVTVTRARDVYGVIISQKLYGTLDTVDFSSPLNFVARTDYYTIPPQSSLDVFGTDEDKYSVGITISEMTRLEVSRLLTEYLANRYGQQIENFVMFVLSVEIQIEATRVGSITPENLFTIQTKSGRTLSYTVQFVNSSYAGVKQRFFLKITTPGNLDDTIFITYSVAARTQARADYIGLQPLNFYMMRNLESYSTFEPPAGYPTVKSTPGLSDNLDYAQISTRVMLGASWTAITGRRVTLPHSAYANSRWYYGYYPAENDTEDVIVEQPAVYTPLMVIDLDEEISLPVGSSIEFLLDSPNDQVSSITVVRRGQLRPTTGPLDENILAQMRIRMSQFALPGDIPGRLFEDALKQRPFLGRVIPKTSRSPLGLERFAVRSRPTLNTSEPDNSPLIFDRILVGGYSNIRGIRIRIPKTDGLSTFGASYLKYRSKPAREWSGMIFGLQRIPAMGYAAFETSYSNDDELLEIQRVNYNITSNTTTVFAGTPLPASDDDSVVMSIQDLRRIQRKAGE